jgi:hypothetical protein
MRRLVDEVAHIRGSPLADLEQKIHDPFRGFKDGLGARQSNPANER